MAHAAIRPLLGDAYNYDSTGVLRALWRSFVHCLFVEEDGAVVFYKDATGGAKRAVDPKAQAALVAGRGAGEKDELADESDAIGAE